MSLRNAGKALLLLPVKLAAHLCYDRRYLRGRLFEGTNLGWVLIARCIVWQKLIGINRRVPWPVGWRTTLSDHRNIEFDPEWWDIFYGVGIDYQNSTGKIVIGSGTYVAPHVAFVTANHDPVNPDAHLPAEPIVVGRKCWIGTHAVLLPGVRLGDHTVVGAGAVVTRSFDDGRCVIGGVPARLIRRLDVPSPS